jgi:hypothetical protein
MVAHFIGRRPEEEGKKEIRREEGISRDGQRLSG